MALFEAADTPLSANIAVQCRRRWKGRVNSDLDEQANICRIACRPQELPSVCQWLGDELDYGLATLIAEDLGNSGLSLTYVFYRDAAPWIYVVMHLDPGATNIPSIAGLRYGPAADWHEREAEDLFGLTFVGHPRLGEFILHEDWPDGVTPMRRSFDARRMLEIPEAADPAWRPPTILSAPGSFSMPVGPVFADFAEAAHFLLETVGEDVVHTIPRFFYKYRGVEKIAEGKTVDQVLLLAERFSGTAAFAHALAFSQCIEMVCDISPPPRALALRTAFCELERLRHHTASITGICHSTALAIAASQAALIEEDLLRLSGEIAHHRYLFGVAVPGGVTIDLSKAQRQRILQKTEEIGARLDELYRMLRYSSSFIDRLEEVGIVSLKAAMAYGLVGPIARASGINRDIRRLRPYEAYPTIDFALPVEREGDGYARLRVFFQEARQSIAIISQVLPMLPPGAIRSPDFDVKSGAALATVEAPSGAAFHWVRLARDGTIVRYHITPPAFINWHGFHIATENFAFQDFPIILASFGLSNAECDR